MLADVMLACAGATLAAFLAVWLVSLAVRDASIVDIAWGPGFALGAWIAYATGDGAQDRRLLIALLVSAWGLRLGAHLARRNIGTDEDARYAAMRRRHGRRFWLVSLGTVFALQAAVMWVVSLPVQAAAADATPAGLGALDFAGAAVWLAGFGFEAIGDAQLARFKREPAGESAVMDRGLWRYTRHPNYFGDAVMWFGIWLIALSSGSAWWTVIGPVLMTFFLTKVSGVPMLERRMAARRPGYAEYMRRTSAFFPRPPKRDR